MTTMINHKGEPFDDSEVDYKLLLWKYLLTLIGKDLIDHNVCAACLDAPEIFTELELESIHALAMLDGPPGGVANLPGQPKLN